MGTLTNLNPLPPELVTDSELAAAIEAHANTKLIDHGRNATDFDCNNWNPPKTSGHEIALNSIYVIPLNTQFQPLTIANMPPTVAYGQLIQLDSQNGASVSKTQFFLGAPSAMIPPVQLFFRVSSGNTWPLPWLQIPTTGLENLFDKLQTFAEGVKIGGIGTQIKSVISQVFTIDPPLLASGQVQHPGIPLTIAGAAIGDFVQIAPIGTDIIFTGIWPFEFRGVVTAANTIVCYPLNDWSGGSIDLLPFQIRVVVTRF